MKMKLILLLLLLTACASPRALATPNSNDIQLSGAYTDYTLSASGTASDPIVVWGNGATLRCVLITGSYIVWRDTTVTGCQSFGIRIKGAHVQILNNTVTDVVRSNWDGSKCSGAGSWDSAIRAADTTDVLISGNSVYRVCGEGISVLRSSFVTVENNTVYDAFSVNIYPDNSFSVTIRNNWSYSTGDARYYKNGQVARGILLGAESYSGWGFQVRNLLIENNTLERVRGISYYAELTGSPSSIVVRDNKFIGVAAPLVNLGTWATVSGNVSVTATPPGTPQTATGTATIGAMTATPSRTPPAPTSTATPAPSVTPSPTCVLVYDKEVRIFVCP